MMKTVLVMSFGVVMTGLTYGTTRWMGFGYADLGDIWLSLSGEFIYDFYRRTWQWHVLRHFDYAMLCVGGLVLVIAAMKSMVVSSRLLYITLINFGMLVAFVSLDAGAMRAVTRRHGAELAHMKEWKERDEQRGAQHDAAPLPPAPQARPSEGAR